VTGLPAEAAALVAEALAGGGRIVVLTGAGVSAASGIPTFRGPEGYWTVGSDVYTPQQLATQAMFRSDPARVWTWYLWRLGVCRAAEPNPAHHALVDMERALGDRFLLITQNVDGLHTRAGSTLARTYAIHGHIERMRCAGGCGATLLDVPAGVGVKESGDGLTATDRRLLRCPSCGGWARPHVLWFDELYDEASYRFDSSLRAARDATLLVTVGTSGATNLPSLVVRTAVDAGAALVDVNPEGNPFGDLAQRLPRGAAVRAEAADALPALARLIREHEEGARRRRAPS
jgi:NAD-dependent deacetylase